MCVLGLKIGRTNQQIFKFKTFIFTKVYVVVTLFKFSEELVSGVSNLTLCERDICDYGNLMSSSCFFHSQVDSPECNGEVTLVFDARRLGIGN